MPANVSDIRLAFAQKIIEHVGNDFILGQRPNLPFVVVGGALTGANSPNGKPVIGMAIFDMLLAAHTLYPNAKNGNYQLSDKLTAQEREPQLGIIERSIETISLIGPAPLDNSNGAFALRQVHLALWQAAQEADHGMMLLCLSSLVPNREKTGNERYAASVESWARHLTA